MNALLSSLRLPAILLTALVAAGCAAQPPGSSKATTSFPAPTSSSGAATSSPAPHSTVVPTHEPLVLEGRLVFGRFDVEIRDMTVWIADADGSNSSELVPGAHYIVCVTGDSSVVMAGPNGAGILVLSTVGLDGKGYRELPSPDGHLHFGVGACLAEGRVPVEGWDDGDLGRAGIYLVDLAGKARPERLTTAPAGKHDIPGCVLVDGRIAFLRAGIDQAPGTLHLVAGDGSGEAQIGSDRYGTGPACSQDGRQVLVEVNSHIFLVDVADGSRTEVTSDAPEFKAHKYGAAFGPGVTIGFSLKSPGPFHDIWAMRLDGTGLTRITKSPGLDNESPRWVLDP